MANTENPDAFKHLFDRAGVARIADLLGAASDAFDRDAFLAHVLPTIESLEMKARVALITDGLHAALPLPFPDAVAALLQILGPPGAPSGTDAWGPASERGVTSLSAWPVTRFVAEHGLEHPEVALDALEEMTRRFTAEFALRPFLLRYPELTLERLRTWVQSPDQHLRRAASEGTRPRLPWGIRLKPFIADPEPVLALIAPLRADPEDYVQRSVGNNLNDIGKDHPDRLLGIAAEWQDPASPATGKILRRALRSLVKEGAPEALRLMGYTVPARVVIEDPALRLEQVTLGQTQELTYTLVSTAEEPQRLLIDYVLHLVRARGKTGEKVFKGRPLTLAPGERRAMVFKLPLKAVTTRRYYSGAHRLQLQVCGERRDALAFHLEVPA